MNNKDFWDSVTAVITKGFTPEGLQKLDEYAEHFITRRLVYQRFSPAEQHGCAAGGPAHVVASLLAGAETYANRNAPQDVSGFQRELQQGKEQTEIIEQWAKAIGCWTDDVENALQNVLGTKIAEGGEAMVYDHGASLVKSIGLDYFVQPILALDRITLHNTCFPETKLYVLGFGKADEEFKIIVEQAFVKGTHVPDSEISTFAQNMDFKQINPKNWTYATPEIYLSDLHDENVIHSEEGNIFVVDCDIRINTPELRCGGVRELTTEVKFNE